MDYSSETTHLSRRLQRTDESPFLCLLMMKFCFQSTAIALVIAISVGGCTPERPALKADPTPTSMASQSDIVGTWRLLSISEGEKKIDIPTAFYCRFYADGKAATWPVPNGAISYGTYTVKDGQLILPDAPLSDKVSLRVSNGKMWQWNERGVTSIYHQIVPDLKPGDLP